MEVHLSGQVQKSYAYACSMRPVIDSDRAWRRRSHLRAQACLRAVITLLKYYRDRVSVIVALPKSDADLGDGVSLANLGTGEENHETLIRDSISSYKRALQMAEDNR